MTTWPSRRKWASNDEREKKKKKRLWDTGSINAQETRVVYWKDENIEYQPIDPSQYTNSPTLPPRRSNDEWSPYYARSPKSNNQAWILAQGRLEILFSVPAEAWVGSNNFPSWQGVFCLNSQKSQDTCLGTAQRPSLTWGPLFDIDDRLSMPPQQRSEIFAGLAYYSRMSHSSILH